MSSHLLEYDGAGRVRVAVVTGAASGIGATTTKLLRENGWTVIGVDLQPSDSDLSIELDVRDREGFAAAVDGVVEQFGGVTLLVNAAGYDQHIDFTDITDEVWKRMVDVLLGGTVNSVAAVLPHMLRANDGCVIAIASELGLMGCEYYVHYASAKAAVIGFVKALSLEMAQTGVRVNAIAPGSTDTPLLPADSEWRTDAYVHTLPLRRIVDPLEIAGAALFLADEGSYFNGEVLSPNAGAVI